MTLNDSQIGVFIAKVLHLGKDKRQEYLAQVDNLIAELERKIKEESSFKVTRFLKTGSLTKGTVLKPRDGVGVDADIAAFLDMSEADRDDVDKLHSIIRELLLAVYPQMKPEQFEVQPRTLGIHFSKSGLDVDLVPVIPILSEPKYGWQPSSQGGAPVKTSIQGQLEFINKRKNADPRYRNLVRLLKRWRNHQGLERLRSFAIELIVAHLNDTKGNPASLESGLQRFFHYVAQSALKIPISFPELGKVTTLPSDPVVILDPVNRNNNVTMRLTEDERKEIVAAATTAWETLVTAQHNGTKGETLDLWREVMGRSFAIDEQE